jgi:small subunit ribosomal protein S21
MARNNINSAGRKGVTGNTVIVGDLPIAVALRKFKKKVEESGVLEAVKEKMFYEKPTTARKRAKGAAKARWRKKLKNDQLPPKLY